MRSSRSVGIFPVGHALVVLGLGIALCPTINAKCGKPGLIIRGTLLDQPGGGRACIFIDSATEGQCAGVNNDGEFAILIPWDTYSRTTAAGRDICGRHPKIVMLVVVRGQEAWQWSLPVAAKDVFFDTGTDPIILRLEQQRDGVVRVRPPMRR